MQKEKYIPKKEHTNPITLRVRELISKRRRLKPLNISARDSLYSRRRSETRREAREGERRGPGLKRRQRSMRRKGKKKKKMRRTGERTDEEEKNGQGERGATRNGEKDVAVRVSSCGRRRPGRRTLNITACYADSKESSSVPRAGPLADPEHRYRMSCRIRRVHRPPPPPPRST